MTDAATEAFQERARPLIEKAALALGPDATEYDVSSLAIRLAVATNPEGHIMSDVTRFLGAQAFRVGRLDALRTEEKTSRVIVRFVTTPPGADEPQIDELRTDPTWTETGRRMAEFLKGCVGHKGVAFKAIEDAGVHPPGAKDPTGRSIAGQPRKSRVIVHFIDQGPADGASNGPPAQPQAPHSASPAPQRPQNGAAEPAVRPGEPRTAPPETQSTYQGPRNAPEARQESHQDRLDHARDAMAQAERAVTSGSAPQQAPPGSPPPDELPPVPECRVPIKFGTASDRPDPVQLDNMDRERRRLRWSPDDFYVWMETWFLERLGYSLVDPALGRPSRKMIRTALDAQRFVTVLLALKPAGR